MATTISTAARNAAADAILGLIDAESGAGTAQIRTGTKPASVSLSATGTLLGTLTLSDPAFNPAALGVAMANPVTGDPTADETGTAEWFRVFDSEGVAVMDGTITEAGDGGDMILDDVNIIAGGTINISAWTVTMPEG